MAAMERPGARAARCTSSRRARAAARLFLAAALLGARAGDAQPAGVVSELFAGDSRGRPAARRLESTLGFDWGEAPPDLRLEPGPFTMRFRGRLFVPGDGDYGFHLHLSGSARLTIGGALVLEAERASPGWADGSALALEYGYHDLELDFEATASTRRLAVFWRSEEFELEPLGAAHLQPPPADAAPDGRFESGHLLARALRCAACHLVPGAPPPRPAPSLARAGAALERTAILGRMRSPGAARTAMPHYALAEEEALAVLAYLEEAAAAERKAHRSAQGGEETEPSAAEIDAGRFLVLSSGCLACHTLGSSGSARRSSGGPLERGGEARNAAALELWLSPPPEADEAAAHRPELPLDAAERRSIAAFLSSLPSTAEAAAAGKAAAGDAGRGRELIEQLGCGACHRLPDAVEIPAAPALHRDARLRWERSCLEPTAAGGSRRFRFEVDRAEREAILAFFAALAPGARRSPFEEGRLLLGELGCAGCHTRQGPTLETAVLEAAAGAFRGLEPALRPPPLEGAGDKLLDGALREALRGGPEERPPRRPWLLPRMPRFRLEEDAESALVRFLRARDGIPERAPRLQAAPDRARLEAGSLLLGPRGFGCASCHAIGAHQPEAVALSARGPDLQGLDRRLRLEWFLRWMRAPSRIDPGVEMPGIAAGFPGLLGGERDLQLLALWEALAAGRGLPPPEQGLVREVRPRGAEPLVIRDVFRLGVRWVPRGMAIGFAGGAGVLYDLEACAPVAFWSGALARQRTEGKTWLWEPGAPSALPGMPALPSIALARGGETRFPIRRHDLRARLAGWTLLRDGSVVIEHDLEFSGAAAVRIEENVRQGGGPPAAAGSVSLVRRLRIERPPADELPLFVLALPAAASPRLERGELIAIGPLGRVTFAARPATAAGAGFRRLDGAYGADPLVFAHPLEPQAQGFAIEIASTWTAAGPPSAGAPGTREERRSRREIDLAPGFRATILPLPASLMPTGFAFLADGTAVATSLDGDLVALRDLDGDDFEESCLPLGPLLSAPFGVLVEGRDIVVSHKPELLRLTDLDGDGRFERAAVIASGWGVTHDYHDWTFGLARGDGAYYVLLGSDYQQKGRPLETARLRGKALRIAGDGEIVEVARGLRFTAGLARNREGEIFFSDNQGEANTFNEINHLRPGRSYGVPALEDPEADRGAEPEPPAIQVPHPWTRSVNGLCFLEQDGAFGTYEGHGIGCEYDNRLLIRFTLERVGETYQGACYPFSLPAAGKAGFLGPISCAVSPSGDIYIGCLHESGWGGGNNRGSVVRLRREGDLPFGIREARAAPGGFLLELTEPCAPGPASDPASYTVTAYRRIWHGGYSTADQDRHQVEVLKASPAADMRSVTLALRPLRAGFLYEIHARPLRGDGKPLWPSLAYCTLHVVPSSRP
jgi:mono/diheme cytochrome c family protein